MSPSEMGAEGKDSVDTELPPPNSDRTKAKLDSRPLEGGDRNRGEGDDRRVEVFDPGRRLAAIADAVPQMEQTSGPLTTPEASAIFNAAAAAGEPTIISTGMMNLLVPARLADGSDAMLRFPRGDRPQREVQPVTSVDTARQARQILDEAGLGDEVQVPRTLWAGEDPAGERAEIQERFPGPPVDRSNAQQVETALDLVADAITTFATREPSLLYEIAPELPRTCGEAHAEMRSYYHDQEPSYWFTFPAAYDAIGAQRDALELSPERLVHPRPTSPRR